MQKWRHHPYVLAPFKHRLLRICVAPKPHVTAKANIINSTAHWDTKGTRRRMQGGHPPLRGPWDLNLSGDPTDLPKDMS